MPTNEYGQPTDSKGNVLTQSQVIEAELEPILKKAVQDWIDQGRDPEHVHAMKNFLSGKAITLKKDLAALVLKHRHDVYFAAYRDGLVQGRKEGQAMLDSSEEE